MDGIDRSRPVPDPRRVDARDRTARHHAFGEIGSRDRGTGAPSGPHIPRGQAVVCEERGWSGFVPVLRHFIPFPERTCTPPTAHGVLPNDLAPPIVIRGGIRALCAAGAWKMPRSPRCRLLFDARSQRLHDLQGLGRFQAGAGKTHVPKVDAGKFSPAKVGIPQAGTCEDRPCEIGAAKAGTS